MEILFLTAIFLMTIWKSLEREISNTPGVFEHGLFLEISKLGIIANNGEVKKITV